MQKSYALVTGASSGIGYEIAEILAAKGYSLIIVARREDRLQELKRQLTAKYNSLVEIIVLDLSQKEAAITLHNHTQQAGFDVEILVNNAGFGMQCLFLEQSMERMAEMVQLNIVTLTHLTQLYAKDFVQRGGGRILQVASAAAFLPSPFLSSYAATKSYVFTFSEALTYELRNTPVTITTLYPGFTATEFGDVAEVKVAWLIRATQMQSRKVAEAGVRAMFRGKRAIVPGFFNKVNAWFSTVFPRGMIIFFTGKILGGVEKH